MSGKRLTAQEIEMQPGETTLGYYERIAATADNRLRAIESLRHQEHFTNVDQYAYARAMRDIQSYGGNKRFSTKPPEDSKLLAAKISDIKRFLNAPSSTKSGIIESYESRANTLNQKYGLNMSWQELADLFDSGLFANLEGKYASETAMRIIGTIKGLTKRDIKEIEENATLKGDSILDQNVIDTIRDEDISVLFKR